jgi:hypothetical protein
MERTSNQTIGTEAKPLRPVKINGKWGYFREGDGLVIEARYERAHEFSEGLAVVELDQWDHDKKVCPLCAVIDKNGQQTAFPPVRGVPNIGGFSEGFLLFVYLGYNVKDGPYMDKEGRVHFDGKGYKPSGVFIHGRARVKLDNKYGFIDINGELVIPPRFEDAYHFDKDGLALVKEMETKKNGIINTLGNYILEPTNELKYGHEGVAVATSPSGYQFIDYKGRPLFDGLFFKHGPGMFKDGMAAYLHEEDGLIGFIDRDGNKYEPQFHCPMSYFSEGLCAVELPNGRKVYINRKCEEVIDISRFTDADEFQSGLAAVWIGEKLGYINRLGEHVWEPRE